MKKWILSCSLLSLLLTPSTQAQSTFTLQNRDSFSKPPVDAPVFDAFGIPLAGTNYLAELYGGAAPDALAPAADEEGKRLAAPFRTQGYFFNFEGAFVRSVPPRAWAWLQLRAWDARLGTNYEQVVARGLGGYGESPLFYARGGSQIHLGPPPQPLVGLQSFRLRPVTPAVLMRSVRRHGDQVVIELNEGFKRYQLQQTAALGQPWQNVGEPTTATSVTNNITGGTQFFRVVALLD
ncbi:MAG: hypothetical protein HYY23_00020 [Verrucomicrobia bacterium]|nr:hypothetical protein [Verrucomicrobiota bacterium]